MASGTSNPVTVSGEDLQSRKNPSFSPVEGVETTVNGKPTVVKPPVGSANGVSESLTLNHNAFPEFVFEKVAAPEYGVSKDAIARYTGVPVNRPDYVNDYHFIGIMRIVDKLVNPSYKGKILNIYNTPESKS